MRFGKAALIETSLVRNKKVLGRNKILREVFGHEKMEDSFEGKRNFS